MNMDKGKYNQRYTCYVCNKKLNKEDLKFVLPYAGSEEGKIICAQCYEKYLLQQGNAEVKPFKNAHDQKVARPVMCDSNILQ
ncbi:MAG: hypothetical protein QXD11_01495 [Candidatus Micrarchaeaceae archaeon]